jgi:hypothetical protein
MSKEQPGATTRRAFLGTATVATAASLSVPMAGADQSAEQVNPAGTVKLAEANVDAAEQAAARAKAGDWTKPAALAIPKGGYFKLEQGRYGPIFPKTPACYGFSVIAKVIPGREDAFYKHAQTMQKAVEDDPEVLEVLKAHYLKWMLIPIKGETYMMYQGIFDTDFDKYTEKYTEDAVALFNKTGITTVFENLEGWPADWRTNASACVKFFRDHHCPSFLEYSEHPYVSCAEIKKALKVRATFATMLDQMQ